MTATNVLVFSFTSNPLADVQKAHIDSVAYETYTLVIVTFVVSSVKSTCVMNKCFQFNIGFYDTSLKITIKIKHSPNSQWKSYF